MIALFFDTETTGFPSKKNPCQIVQIGAVLQDTETKRVLGELNVICQASIPIPKVVSEIHGITDELSATYGVAQEVADKMFAILADKADILVAHNIKFDNDVIEGAWTVSPKIMASKQNFCTMMKSMDIVGLTGTHGGRSKWPKLIQAYQHFFDGQSFDNAHDAMADVRACRDVYFALLAHSDKQVGTVL